MSVNRFDVIAYEYLLSRASLAEQLGFGYTAARLRNAAEIAIGRKALEAVRSAAAEPDGGSAGEATA